MLQTVRVHIKIKTANLERDMMMMMMLVVMTTVFDTKITIEACRIEVSLLT